MVVVAFVYVVRLLAVENLALHFLVEDALRFHRGDDGLGGFLARLDRHLPCWEIAVESLGWVGGDFYPGGLLWGDVSRRIYDVARFLDNALGFVFVVDADISER